MVGNFILTPRMILYILTVILLLQKEIINWHQVMMVYMLVQMFQFQMELLIYPNVMRELKGRQLIFQVVIYHLCQVMMD